MSNVDTHREDHAAFNRRAYEDIARTFREDATYTDHPRNLTTKGRREFVDWLKGWTSAFSDAAVAEPRYIDGGEYSIALFQGRGTNDGAMGQLPGNGRRMDLPFCEILRYDESGQVVSGEVFYDAATMMVQLGVMEPPPTG